MSNVATKSSALGGQPGVTAVAPASPPALQIAELSFTYRGAAQAAPLFDRLSLELPRGARCLLLGANGVGKSSLLRLIAGKHMIDPDRIRIFGRAAFHDTTLAADVAFVGGPFPFSADISVATVLEHRPGIDPGRRREVLELLEISPDWRMHRLSDGQRRRVQLLLELERPVSLLLLDEVTAELDILARADLLRFLQRESTERGLTVIYASHVLEGLREFGTHLLFLSPGPPDRIRRFAPLDQVAELRGGSLLSLCEEWLSEDRAATRRRP